MAVTESEALSRFSGTELVERNGNSHEFPAACGAKLPVRLTIRNERNGATDEVLIERPWATIGGDERCDVRLLHPDVSQRHAYLQFVGSRLLCCDLGSRTGTHWSTEIRARSWVKPEDPIYIGPYSIRVHDNEFDSDGTAGAPQPQLELPRVTLSFANARSRTGRSKKSRVRRPVTLIGWSHLSNVRLQHSSVGRVHASLVWTPLGLWIVDLLCRSGTRVNGQPVDAARLLEGDEIVLGRFELRVSYGDSQENDVEPVRGESTVAGEANGQSARDVPLGLVVNGHERPRASLLPRSPLIPMQSTSVQLSREMPPAALSGPPELPEQVGEISALRASGLPLPQISGLNDSVALALMQQFSTMQQQLFDHTQQLLAVMAQTFSAAHTRQLDLIRSELMRVHDVNRELQELNLELTLARQAQPNGAGAAPSNSAPANLDGAATKETIPEQPIFEVAPDAASAAAPQRKPRRAKPGRPPRESGPVAEGGDKAGADMHGWLSGRINELEQERTTRWQKILQLLAPSAGPS
jgi:pSer/pThr/pTyr-binding forkhead associated (FHA) protein